MFIFMGTLYKYGTMAFNISEIRSSISELGIQKTAHFACSIMLPPSISGRSMDYTLHRVNSVNLPGFNLSTDDIRHKGFGLSEKRPIQAGYEDVSVTLIADGKGEMLDSLMEWMELIYPTNTETHSDSNVEYFEYPSNYYGGLEIYVYDIAGKKHTTYTLVNPFPYVLGAVQMGWENTDSLMMIPISFAYRSFKRNSSSSGAITNISNLSPSNIESILV